jgi:hypothetical protein
LNFRVYDKPDTQVETAIFCETTSFWVGPAKSNHPSDCYGLDDVLRPGLNANKRPVTPYLLGVLISHGIKEVKEPPVGFEEVVGLEAGR